ncbi:nuclear transport factor 2 family protein [uncultured Polaribacter sp.]|uniref:nuclear transport factor 2 family protein n=1 Tax=uncultured Polaribacter sp. TaxID=174711 RepID=UPI00260C8024|nr:nuclear transport factor 2 family protein [uncultured Polaribacter sp.]
MKNIIFFLFIFIVFASCKKNVEVLPAKTHLEIKENVNSVLNNWHKAASEANYKIYFDTMDSVSVFIGTDASENWTKEQFENFSKPHFDKGKAWDFKVFERNVYVNDSKDFVWFDELLNTWMGTCRGSGVLVKIDKNWKIKHYVLSVTIPNDDITPVINIKREKDSIFLSQYKK